MAKLFDSYRRDAWGKPVGRTAPPVGSGLQDAKEAHKQAKARSDKPKRAKSKKD